MLLDGVAYLGLKDGLFVRSARFPDLQFHVVRKAHKPAAGVDFVYLKPGIFRPLGHLFERIAGPDRDDLFFDRSAFHQLVEGKPGRNRLFLGLDAVKPKKHLILVVLFYDRGYLDAFHEPLAVCFERRKPVDDVIGIPVRGAVAQGKKRVEGG